MVGLGSFAKLTARINGCGVPCRIVVCLVALLPLGTLCTCGVMSVVFSFMLTVSDTVLICSFTGGGQQLGTVLACSTMLLSTAIVFGSSF